MQFEAIIIVRGLVYRGDLFKKCLHIFLQYLRFNVRTLVGNWYTGIRCSRPFHKNRLNLPHVKNKMNKKKHTLHGYASSIYRPLRTTHSNKSSTTGSNFQHTVRILHVRYVSTYVPAYSYAVDEAYKKHAGEGKTESEKAKQQQQQKKRFKKMLRTEKPK